VYRPLSTSSLVHARVPPWIDEKLRSENLEVNEKNISEIYKPRHSIHPDTVIKMQADYDVSWSGYKKRQERLQAEFVKKDQMYLAERVTALGPELAAATFLVHRGAAVKFHEFDEWVVKDKDDLYKLPREQAEGYTLEAIDMGGFNIIASGFDNLAGLENLKSLTLRNVATMDDWCLDLVSSLFYNTLEYLDISNCPKITERSLGVMHRFRKLKTLEFQQMPGVKNPELMTILLEEALPDCDVQGVDYVKRLPSADSGQRQPNS